MDICFWQCFNGTRCSWLTSDDPIGTATNEQMDSAVSPHCLLPFPSRCIQRRVHPGWNARMLLLLSTSHEVRYIEERVLHITHSSGGRNMALSGRWRRLWNFRRWKKATTPMLLNAETGELIPLSSYTAPPEGKWMLRRPLTLPDSPVPLFLEVRGIPTRKKRSDVKPAAPSA